MVIEKKALLLAKELHSKPSLKLLPTTQFTSVSPQVTPHDPVCLGFPRSLVESVLPPPPFITSCAFHVHKYVLQRLTGAYWMIKKKNSAKNIFKHKLNYIWR